MKKISGKQIKVQRSEAKIDWKEIATQLAEIYMKSRCIQDDENRTVSIS